MALTQYKQKRSKAKSPEPFGGKPTDKELKFVVQKHAASHLHYDFRLEMNGVLKSWAVPKGPSINPKTKRLAVMVEDHPYDYRLFEGVIPKGEYGGGTVMVWDEGTYEPLNDIEGKQQQQKEMLAQLKAGSLKFNLKGQKLKGEFALVKTKQMGENTWLLIKHSDGFASEEDITKQDKSALSGQTIDAIKNNNQVADIIEPNLKLQHKTLKKSQKKSGSKAPAVAISKEASTLINKAPRSKFPAQIKPMLATLIDKPFHDSAWMYEVKWDGYRAIAKIQNGHSTLLSRNGLAFDNYNVINNELNTWGMDIILDGEVVVLNKHGVSDFNALQQWNNKAAGNLVYYVFDIIWYKGKNLTKLPLNKRLQILNEVLPTTNDDVIRKSPIFEVNGIEFFHAAETTGLEGIMAKRKKSIYTSESRSKDWLKIKVQKRQEVVICGYNKKETSPRVFSALLLGVYNKKKLVYIGKVGTGFSDKLQKELVKQFEPLIITKSPFDIEPNTNKPSRFNPKPKANTTIWLKPLLVCEVNYAEITDDNVFRQASFKGMRVDKIAKEVKLELPEQIAPPKKSNRKIKEKAIKTSVTVKVNQRKLKTPTKTLLNDNDETQSLKINKHEIKFSHLNKLYWPEESISKRDMFNYYHEISSFILPYLKDRPLSLNRYPGGIHAKNFYQKDVSGKAPEWAKTIQHESDNKTTKEYLIGQNEATLMWMVNLGCIEINPWFSRANSIDNPDYCVIDLDPGKNTTFEQVIKTAQVTHDVLDSINVPSYAKTSGSTGIHIYIPLGAKYTYDQSKEFARIIAKMVEAELPTNTTTERVISKRNGKLYIDFLQNRKGATIAAPYSLRPILSATVSMPLHWDEIRKGLKMQDFTIKNAFDRLEKEGDIFKHVLGQGIDLQKVVKLLSSTA